MRIGELSHRVGVSTDTLRAWERRYGLLSPRRTERNARLYSAVDESRVRLMKRHLRAGISPAQAAELAVSAHFAVTPGQQARVLGRDARQAIDEMRAALDDFDETSARHAIEKVFAEYSSSAVIRDVLLPYLREVGERWAADHMTVAQEHFASNFLLARLLALARGWDRGLGPRALLACAPEEHHSLPLVAFGIALHDLGWRITYLGAATPVAMVHSAADRVNPELIMVSTTVPGALERDIAAFRDLAARWPLSIAGAAASPGLAAECGARYVREDPVGAAYAIAAAETLHLQSTGN